MAQRRDRVGRNVAELVDTPEGQTGRPSKSLTLDQAARLIAVSLDPQWRLGAYVVLCLMSGIRTEEARQLRWADVDLENAAVFVLGSDRHRGDTKTPKSRRGLGIAQMAVTALTAGAGPAPAPHGIRGHLPGFGAGPGLWAQRAHSASSASSAWRHGQRDSPAAQRPRRFTC